MIHYKNARHNGGMEPLVIEGYRRVDIAFGSFVFAEIGYGTTVTKLTPTEIHCRTGAFGVVDVVEFSGTEADMRPLVLAASYYATLLSDHGVEVVDHVMNQIPHNMHGGYNPYDIVQMGSILEGQNLIGIVSLLAVGVEPTMELLAFRYEDLLAAAELHLETGVPVQEVLELA